MGLGLACNILLWLIAIDGGAGEAIANRLIGNSMFQTEESSVISFETAFSQEISGIQALIQASFSASQLHNAKLLLAFPSSITQVT